MKMKPFDLQKALAGDPICTRNGSIVAQFTMFYGVEDIEDICLCGVAMAYGQNRLLYWLIDGTFDDEEEDLMMVDFTAGMKSGEVYYSPNLTSDDLYSLNVWGDGGDYEYDHRMLVRGMVHMTKKDAIKHANEIIKKEDA